MRFERASGCVAVVCVLLALLSLPVDGQEPLPTAASHAERQHALEDFVARRMRAERRRPTFHQAVESRFSDSAESWDTPEFKRLLAEIENGPALIEGGYQVPHLLAHRGTPYLPEYAALKILRLSDAPAPSMGNTDASAARPRSPADEQAALEELPGAAPSKRDTGKPEETPGRGPGKRGKQDDKEFGHRVKNLGGKVKGFFKEKF